MPHISKEKIDQKVYRKLFKQFSDVNMKLSRDDSDAFLSSLLTETEQVMLTKRFACVLMLHEGYSQYTVEKTLKLSSSTVARISGAKNIGMYDDVIHIFEKKRIEKEKFWDTLEVLLRLGMPSMGKDRWKHLPS